MLRSVKQVGQSVVSRVQQHMKTRRGKIILSLIVIKWLVVVFFFRLATSSAATGEVVSEQKSHHNSASSENHLAAVKAGSSSASGDISAKAGQQIASRYLSTILTSRGPIEVEFLPEAAPKTVENFVQLITMGFFNNTSFYRYEPNFVLQGGGWPTKASPLPSVPLEYNLPNFKYFISTARTSDPNSATCEFSIQINDNSKWLGPGGSDKYGYAVFAKVVGGFDVIEGFASLPTKQSGGLKIIDPVVKIISWSLKRA